MSTEMGTEIDFRGLEKLVLAFLLVLIAVLTGLTVSRSAVTASAATVEHVPVAEQTSEETDLTEMPVSETTDSQEPDSQEMISQVSLRDILAGTVDLIKSADVIDISLNVRITPPTVHIITDHMEIQTRPTPPLELSLTFGSSTIQAAKDSVKKNVDTILAIDRVLIADVITTTAVIMTTAAVSLLAGIEFSAAITIQAISVFLSAASLSAILLSSSLVPVKILALPLAGFAAVLPLPGFAALTLIRPLTALFAADVILLLTIGILVLRISALPLSALAVTAPAALGILCFCQSAIKKKKKPYPSGEFSPASDMALFYCSGDSRVVLNRQQFPLLFLLVAYVSHAS